MQDKFEQRIPFATKGNPKSTALSWEEIMKTIYLDNAGNPFDTKGLTQKLTFAIKVKSKSYTLLNKFKGLK
jgi:hypothetical protein